MKCPSKFCGHNNIKNGNYCGKCGLDLSMDKRMVLFWDGMYASFLDMKEEFGEKFPEDISLLGFREMMKNKPILAFALGMKCAMKHDESANKKNKTESKNEKGLFFPKKGLYSIFLKRLKKLEKQPGKIITFPKIFQSICTNFKMTKDQAWEVIFILNELGLIEIVKFKGIKLLY